MSTERIQRERELFERYKKQRAPGANLQRIGDEYVDMDVQWHFETWLARADLAPPEADLSSDERVAVLCDLSYRAGLRAGWNYCTDGDQTGFARSLESTREALAVLNEHRQKGAPAAPEQVEHERKLFEARMRRVAPGVNLEMIGDRYNELDTQWKFELWLARAALAGKGGE